jgi:tape measure domain-containing protein
MALNIGQINFGVDANTAGLRKAIGQLNTFQKKTDQVARSQTKGAAAIAAAMSRQESAIKKSFQATLQLQKAMRKAGAPPEKIAQVSAAFKRLTREMTSGKLTVVEYNRAVDAFSAKMGRAKRGLQDFTKAQQQGAKGLARYSVILRDLESSAVLALGPLSGLGARIRSIGAIVGRGTGGLSTKFLVATGAIVTFVASIGLLGVKAASVGDALKSIRFRMDAAAGSAEGGANAFRFVIGISRRLGLEMEGLSKSYSRFLAASQGTAIEGRQTKVIFEQVARAAAALKLPATDVEGVMRALEQIMSKGTVQAEELRGQLGDRLPGAFRIAAEAMGVSTRELNRMLKAGEVVSDEFLPKFAAELDKAFGANAERNLETMGGAVNVLSTNFKLLMADVDAYFGISEKTAKSILAVGNTMGWLAGETNFLGEAVSGNTAEWEMMLEAMRLVEAGPDLGAKFTDMNKEFVKSVTEMTALGDALQEFQQTGGDIDHIVNIWKGMAEASKLNSDEMKVLAEKMSLFLGMNIPETTRGIAEGMAEIARRTEEFGTSIESIQNAPDALKEINDQMNELRNTAASLRQGPEAAQLFKDVGAKALEFEAALKGVIGNKERRNQILDEYRALLMEIRTLENEHKTATKDAADAAREQARNQERVNKALTDAGQATEVLRGKLMAMSRGPEGLEMFTKVEEPLIKMRQRLEEAGVPIDEMGIKLTEYEALLQQFASMTDKWARASEQAADAFVNGLEDILVKGKSVGDMLRDLAKELLRVMLRAGVLDGLRNALSGIFSGGMSPVSVAATAVGGGSGAAPGLEGPFATGGSFKLSGSGGADNIPFFGIGKAGETVSVTRADQKGSSSGGGVNLTINAPGADAGTIERIREIVKTEMAPQIIQAATDHTMGRIKRPRFA